MPNNIFAPPDPAANSPSPGGAPDWMGAQGDIFKELESQYGKVDSSFSTDDFDKAAASQYSNILSQGETSGNTAAAEYSARARQSGGSAEGAGLVKAQAIVGARSQVADFRLKQVQYDIAQKEAARQLAANIASQMGGLRMDYLKNLTGWNEELQRSKTSLGIAGIEAKSRTDVANIGASSENAKTAEERREFDIRFGPRPWSGRVDNSGLFTGTDQWGHPLSTQVGNSYAGLGF